jgi:hypothetical protein
MNKRTMEEVYEMTLDEAKWDDVVVIDYELNPETDASLGLGSMGNLARCAHMARPPPVLPPSHPVGIHCQSHTEGPYEPRSPGES